MSAAHYEKKGAEYIPLPAQQQRPQRRGRGVRWTVLLLFVSTCLYTLTHTKLPGLPSVHTGDVDVEAELAGLCPQVKPLIPQQNGEVWATLSETYKTEAFLDRAVTWLGGAVRIPTPSYDQMGPVGEDPRWEVFAPFHDYLVEAFPQVHATLGLAKVNTYGLVYYWKGSDESLKPLLLTAHQDVVPVNPDTYDQWEHPPFSGYFDGTKLWGRGSKDDKSGLIGVLSAIESLLELGHKPTRPVVLAFGFDEETSGLHGAYEIGQYLEETYGENAFAMIVDEGGKFGEEHGGVFAHPSVAEKGYTDIRLTVTSPGGHSSVPPPHTSIGILAALLVKYEDNPPLAILKRDSVPYLTAQCLAAHAPVLAPKLRKAIVKSAKSDAALAEAAELLYAEDYTFKALVETTQAIDLVNGGVKTNALPENAEAVINHRIAADSSVGAVHYRATELLKGVAHHFNLSYNAFGAQISQEGVPAFGTLTLAEAFGTALEPAPVTPSSGEDAGPYQLLSGSIKATYASHRGLKKDEIVVAPSLVSGNTDTRYYWKLTPHIFRYSHSNGRSGNGLDGVHTINEAIYADSFVEIVRWFTTLILNADESTSI